jgi:hypothetical protein
MAPLIPIAFELAKYAPGIIAMLGGTKAGEVAGKVVEIARTVTGIEDPQTIIDTIKLDPAKQAEFQLAFGAQQGDMEKAYLADRQDARDRDVEVRKISGGNLRADLAVLAVVLGLISCLVVMVQYKASMPGEVVGILSMIAGIFGACLKDYFAFEFGSSRSSQAKDQTIANLTK